MALVRGGVQSGFTLMEVLVAVAILGIALAAAIRVGSQAAGNTVELRERAHAGWVADNVLARVTSGMEPLRGPERRDGRMEMAGREWPWELRAETAEPPLDLGVPLPGLLEVEVAVFRPGESERPVTLRTSWYSLPGPPPAGGDEDD